MYPIKQYIYIYNSIQWNIYNIYNIYFQQLKSHKQTSSSSIMTKIKCWISQGL